MSDPITIIGASVRAAAESAKRAGFHVIAIDQFGDTDTRQACDQYFSLDGNPDRIAAVCRQTTILQVGGLRRHAALLRRLAASTDAETKLPENAARCDPRGGERVDVLRNPGQLRELCEKANFRFPKTIERAREDTSFAPTIPSLQGRWLRKELESCGGLGVGWLEPGATPAEGEVAQAWVPGRVFGATLLSNGRDVELLGVCRTLLTRLKHRPFVYAGSLGPLPIPFKLSRSLSRLGQLLVADSGHRGLLNVDFILPTATNGEAASMLDAQERPWVLEVNPRWSGSSELIERSLIDQKRIGPQSSLLAMAVAAQRGVDINLLVSDRRCDGAASSESHDASAPPCYLKRIVFARECLRFSRSIPLRDDESLHDVPPEGATIPQGSPTCTVIRRLGASRPDVMQRHRVLVGALSAPSIGD